MAMNVNRGAYFQNNYINYTSQPLIYRNYNHFVHRLTGPDPKVKPLPNMCQQQPFRPMAPSLPDPLRFPLSTSLSPGPPSLQPVQRPPHPPPQPPCPKSLPPPQEEETQTVGDQDSALEDLCRPLYCKLCNVTLNSAQQAQAHYQGKNHNKKLRNFYAGSQQPPPLRVPEVVEPPVQQPPPPATVPVTQSGSFKTGSRVILATENDYCKLCDASFSSPAVAQAHYQGKNHAKRLRLAEAQQRNTFIDTSEANQRRPGKDGNEFKIVKTRRNAYVPQNMPGPYYNPRPRQRIPRDLAMCVTPSGQFYCSMCNSGACEEADFRLHLESKHHKSKVSEQRYRSEMENLGYT
ncbi:zinc finger matrin-type protein 3-like isoform X1 [Acipenser oxyrinchus oxyrinchus]|uniref:Zinc finger matrin-type protein 3 n=1 Tax=Acipenser oxyrinchus oxyrinchus TaxID=40147 RepID=A0AAD8D5B8_ACIOX|nr:zinc finger matrin-type protein 3-like isoform X1 [Acipenser oxyrinchus oxyrinchus]